MKAWVELWPATTQQVNLLYSVVAPTFVYMFYKYRRSSLYLFIILMFYAGLFAFLGSGIQNIYKIFLIIFCVYISLKRNYFSNASIKEIWITLSFFLFSLAFFISAIINGDSITISFSQYSRYAIVFCIFLLLKKELFNPQNDNNQISKLIYELLLIQIIISVAKLFITGVVEGLVGTISFTGGGEGTSLPILAFIFIWYIRNGNFSKKDILFVLALFFVGYLAGKRALWFIMPIVLILFMFYVSRRKITTSFITGLFIIPLLFYLGVRLTPTLNKDNKVWGEFDIGYTLDYAQGYSFGMKGEAKSGIAQGRGGVLLKLYSDFLNKNVNSDFIFGHGLTDIYTTTYEEFDKKGYGINHLGSATGAFQSYISGGFTSVFATMFFAISMLTNVINKRARYVIIGIFLWDYLFYSGLIIRTPALMFLLLFVVVNMSYVKNKDIETSPIV